MIKKQDFQVHLYKNRKNNRNGQVMIDLLKDKKSYYIDIEKPLQKQLLSLNQVKYDNS